MAGKRKCFLRQEFKGRRRETEKQHDTEQTKTVASRNLCGLLGNDADTQVGGAGYLCSLLSFTASLWGCCHERPTEEGSSHSVDCLVTSMCCGWGLGSSSPSQVDSRMVTVAFTEDNRFNNRDMILIRAQERKMSGKEAVAGTQLS